MKRINYLPYMSFWGLVTIFLLPSCEKSVDEKLIGKWQLSDAEIYCTKPDVHRYEEYIGFTLIEQPGYLFLEKITKSEIEKGASFEFYKDNKFFYWSGGELQHSYTGAFKINEDTINMVTDNNVPYLTGANIKLISDSKFRLKYKYTEYPVNLGIPDEEASNHDHTHTYYYDKVE